MFGPSDSLLDLLAKAFLVPFVLVIVMPFALVMIVEPFGMSSFISMDIPLASAL